MSRTAEVRRTTKETSIALTLDLDGTGEARVGTPVGFLTHMLETVARHARFDLAVEASGDVHVDAPHELERPVRRGAGHGGDEVEVDPGRQQAEESEDLGRSH